MIRSFADVDTKRVFRRLKCRHFSLDVQRAAYRKLLVLDGAESINDLRMPPGNRLQKLKGARRGQHSIRINEQWRICFVWKNRNAHEVEISDYHR